MVDDSSDRVTNVCKKLNNELGLLLMLTYIKIFFHGFKKLILLFPRDLDKNSALLKLTSSLSLF